MKSFLKKALVIGAISLAPTAFAVEMTGAGSSFIYPVLSKWAESYKAKSGDSLNISRLVLAAVSSRLRQKLLILALLMLH